MEPTEAMIDGYLRANNEYWSETEKLAVTGQWRAGTAREATRYSLRAALKDAFQKWAVPCEWLHVKTGTKYRILHEGCNEHTGEKIVVYQSVVDRGIWARPYNEFFDGRFQRVTQEAVADPVNDDLFARGYKWAAAEILRTNGKNLNATTLSTSVEFNRGAEEACMDWNASKTKTIGDPEVAQGWRDTFSTSNPYCPCNFESFKKAVKWAERYLKK